MLVLECVRIGLPQYLWRRRRPTRTALLLGATVVVVTVAAMRARYGARSTRWRAESASTRRP